MLASEVIAKAKRDFPEETDARALDDLQTIHDELCFDFKVIPATQTITTLAAGTREYSLDSVYSAVFAVRYHRSATDFDVLMETHVDELDNLNPYWKQAANETPTHYYIQAGKIGLYPPPPTATSGSYPSLQVDMSQRQTLASGTTMGGSLQSYEAWVAGLKYRFALRTGDSRLPIYQKMYHDAKSRLGTMVRSTAAHFNTNLIHPGTWGGKNRAI